MVKQVHCRSWDGDICAISRCCRSWDGDKSRCCRLWDNSERGRATDPEKGRATAGVTRGIDEKHRREALLAHERHFGRDFLFS